jgi:hypothetical protein
MEGQRHPVLPTCPLALGHAQERRGQPRLHRIHRERLHRVVSRAEPAPDHERHLLDEGWMPIGEREHGIGGNLDDHGGLRGLRGRRVWPLLDDGDAAEHLARPQQLEDDVLAGLRIAENLHVAGLDEVEPAPWVALHEDVAAGAVALLLGDARQRLDLVRTGSPAKIAPWLRKVAISFEAIGGRIPPGRGETPSPQPRLRCLTRDRISAGKSLICRGPRVAPALHDGGEWKANAPEEDKVRASVT